MALVGDDCFFFLNAGCVRGSQCTFRHQPAARSTTIVCPQWLQRCCFRPNCVFRHTDDQVIRHQTPCYYEANMGVCLKPRCAFGHLRKSQGPVHMPTPVLPPRPPVLPAMPPVLPASVSVGISSIPPPGPPAINLPLPNNTPVVIREAPVIVEKPVASVDNGNAMPQVVRPPLTPPPALPPPPKLTQMLMGSRPQLQLVPAAVNNEVSPRLDQRPPIGGHQVGTAPPAQNVSILGAAPVTVFPKNEHFNEQVRLFKEMLAGKPGAPSLKKYKDEGYSDDEKGGGTYKVKERQRNKKERKEKEGYKSHKSNKASKDVWSKADEEILYGDYKDVPLDKRSKRKKHKEHKELADSDPEIKIKSYEEILREKALRKLYSKRKEKFNEDFKELVSENLIRKDDIPDKTNRKNDDIPDKTNRKNDVVPDKTNRKNDIIPDKVIRKNKKYSSDGDEVEYFDESKPDVEIPKRRHSKSEDSENSKETKKHDEKRGRMKDEEDGEYRSKNNDIKDSMLKNALIDSENRQSSKYSKKASKRRKHRERNEVDGATNNYDLIEVNSSNGSPKEENDKTESSPEKEDTKESSSQEESDETDSESSDSESSSSEEEEKEETGSKKEEIIIPDETTNIDFTVDYDDDLAMEINQNEQIENTSTKTKKMSSVVSIISKVPSNATSSDKNKYHKKSTEREGGTEFKSNNARHHKTSDSKSNDRDYVKSSESKSNDRDYVKSSESKSNDRDHVKSSESKSNDRDYVKSSESKSNDRDYVKSSESKSNDRDYVKSSESKSNDRDHRRKSPKDSSSNKLEKTENKKVVRLVNTCEEPIVHGRVSPSVIAIKDLNETDNTKIVSPIKSSIVKVKTFEEIMAEKHKRNKHSVTLITDSPVVVSIADSPVVSKSLNATLKEKSTQAKLEILNVPKNQNGDSVYTTAGDAKSLVSKSKVLTDEEKQKRKSLQLYKPPHPVKAENENLGKTAEVKMVVNTGPRKIIRIRKALLSTELIDQSPTGENAETATVDDRKDDKEMVKVRSFEEIIREKRMRQKKEREHVKQMEKENASSNETTATSSSNNLLRRKPVIRRQALPICSAVAASTCSLSKTSTTVAAILNNTTTTTNNTDSYVYLSTVSESKRPIPVDLIIAKVSPLKVVPQKRLRSDSSGTPVVTQAESLENKDFYSKLRSFSSRRTSVTSSYNTVKESEKSQPVMKLRKRSITSSLEASPVSSNHVTTPKILPYTFDTSVQSDTSNETKVDYHGSSRKDIQEALDEEKRKREQDILSDDEFEKEINELGSDDEDLDDINDIDDFMMELEQMIDG